MKILSCCMYWIYSFTVTKLQQFMLSDILRNLVSYVHVNILRKLICFCLSGWASGTGHRRPQRADGEAGEGGTGALGVRWYGLTGQPPTASHSCRSPAPSVLFLVHRRPRHKHKWERPCVRTWPVEEYSTLARNSLLEISRQRYKKLKLWDHFLQNKIRKISLLITKEVTKSIALHLKYLNALKVSEVLQRNIYKYSLNCLKLLSSITLTGWWKET